MACTVIAQRLIVDGEVTLVAVDPQAARPIRSGRGRRVPEIRLSGARTGIVGTALLAQLRNKPCTQEPGQSPPGQASRFPAVLLGLSLAATGPGQAGSHLGYPTGTQSSVRCSAFCQPAYPLSRWSAVHAGSMGGLIHILLVVAIIVVAVRLLQGRKVL
jgi:hypothetical protein